VYVTVITCRFNDVDVGCNLTCRSHDVNIGGVVEHGAIQREGKGIILPLSSFNLKMATLVYIAMEEL
jgi:hypothetical protein